MSKLVEPCSTRGTGLAGVICNFFALGPLNRPTVALRRVLFLFSSLPFSLLHRERERSVNLGGMEPV